jgi:hypothetical protein
MLGMVPLLPSGVLTDGFVDAAATDTPPIGLFVFWAAMSLAEGTTGLAALPEELTSRALILWAPDAAGD